MPTVSEQVGTSEFQQFRQSVESLLLGAMGIMSEKTHQFRYTDESMEGAGAILKHIKSGKQAEMQAVEGEDAALFASILKHNGIPYAEVAEGSEEKHIFLTKDSDSKKLEEVWNQYAFEIGKGFREMGLEEFLRSNEEQRVMTAEGYSEAELEAFRKEAAEAGISYAVAYSEGEHGRFDILFVPRDEAEVMGALLKMEIGFSGRDGAVYRAEVQQKGGGNLSGVILGAEHSGKTFQMKREIFGGMLSPGDRVYVVAETGEYDGFIRRQGGRTVRPERWNPFYMMEEYGLIEEKEKVKARFLRALLAVSGDAGNEAGARRDTETGKGEKTEDEREKDMLYEVGEFLQEPVDFNDWEAVWKFLMERKRQYPGLAEFSGKIGEGRSRNGFPIGTGQEPWADVGAFSQEQVGNLESQADIGASSQEQAGSMEQWPDSENKGRLFLYHAESTGDILMMMDYLWNEMISDRKEGRGSWIFIEAVDGLLKNRFCARYLMKYLQQCSAFRTVVTVAVQDAVGLAGNVEQSVALEELAGGCGYVKLLNLGPVERRKLAEVLNIPNALLPYVTNVEPSKGLILTSASNVPFDDNFLGREDPFIELFL